MGSLCLRYCLQIENQALSVCLCVFLSKNKLHLKSNSFLLPSPYYDFQYLGHYSPHFCPRTLPSYWQFQFLYTLAEEYCVHVRKDVLNHWEVYFCLLWFLTSSIQLNWLYDKPWHLFASLSNQLALSQGQLQVVRHQLMDVKGQHEEAMDQLGERATLAAKLQSELTKADQQNHSFSKEVRKMQEESREWFL